LLRDDLSLSETEDQDDEKRDREFFGDDEYTELQGTVEQQ